MTARKIIKPTILALVCAIALATSNELTFETIAETRLQYEQRFLIDMVDGERIEAQPYGYRTFRDDTPTGYLLNGLSNSGYNGEIAFYVAITDGGQIRQVRVIRHQETPGLGDKIDVNVSAWINQFEGKSQTADWSLKPEGEFDSITGATITANAMIEGIAETLSQATLNETLERADAN